MKKHCALPTLMLLATASSGLGGSGSFGAGGVGVWTAAAVRCCTITREPTAGSSSGSWYPTETAQPESDRSPINVMARAAATTRKDKIGRAHV